MTLVESFTNAKWRVMGCQKDFKKTLDKEFQTKKYPHLPINLKLKYGGQAFT